MSDDLQNNDRLFLQMIANQQKLKVKIKNDTSKPIQGAEVKAHLKQIEMDVLSHTNYKANKEIQEMVVDFLKKVKIDINDMLDNQSIK